MARSFQEGMKHRCANTVQPVKNMSSFGKESKTITLIKSKLCRHVLSCSAMFNDLMTRPLQEGKSKFAYTIDFPSVVSFLIELYMSLCSVSLI